MACQRYVCTSFCLFRRALRIPASFGICTLGYPLSVCLLRNADVFTDPGAERTLAEREAQHASKYQAVFSLDWSTWKGLVEVFGIKEPLIPHRQYEESIVQPRGWYG